MANASQGILGPFNGKVGPVTGYVRNGRNVLRTSTSSVKYTYTPLRTAQWHKIALCNRFTKAFTGTGFFAKSFPAYGNTGNGLNRATSALLSQAITGVYPDMQLDYTQVLVSKGKLPPAENAMAMVMDDGNLHFTFTNNSTTGIAADNDKVILVAYAAALQQAIFTLNAGQRKDGNAVLQTKLFKGYAVDTWIGFLSNNDVHAGNSVYTGSISL